MVTGIEQREKALQGSQVEFSTIFDNAPVVMFLVDSKRRMRRANQATIEFAKRQAKEIIGDRGGEALRCMHSLDNLKDCGFGDFCKTCLVQRTMLDTFETGEGHYRVEAQLPFICGQKQQVSYILISTTPMMVSGEKMVLVCLEDITEMKQTEHVLRESEYLHRITLSNISDAVFMTDDTGTFTYICSNVHVIFGYSFAEVQTFGCISKLLGSDILDADELERLGEIKNIEQEITDKTGRLHSLLVNIKKVSIKEGTILYTCRDITERKLAEEQAHQAELFHISRLNILGEMASGLAHELNQPLCAILSCADLCLRATAGEIKNIDRLNENLRTIETQAERAGNIIQHIRALVKKKNTQYSAIDVNDLIRKTLCFIDTDIRRDEIKLSLELSEQMPKVTADPIQIEQVLLNLLRNAIEAMADTDIEKRSLIIQTTRDSENVVKVLMRDSGDGMTTEVEKQLFNPFFTTKPDGLGVGLSISYSIIEAHHGEFWAKSNSDRGSTFGFTLPVAKTQIFAL
ncbi:MAG: PAS domain S-box protein [Planctomycetes bacterium]|nr:PAS domain S-box protein [Planctomycetota bacterium]